MRMHPNRITFWDSEIWKFIAGFEKIEMDRETSTIKENELHQFEALHILCDLKYLIMASIPKKTWVSNPEPVVRIAIEILRKQNSL
jgi:hypothetical protein